MLIKNIYKTALFSFLMKNQHYRPKLISVNPSSIMPFHNPGNLRTGIVFDYIGKVYVPPIPVIHAPADLLYAGDFVNYNGHHRTLAARKAAQLKRNFRPQCILLENWQDICYLRDNPPRYKGEVYPELIEELDETFEAHRDFIWGEARRFRKLTELAQAKNIPLGYAGALLSTT